MNDRETVSTAEATAEPAPAGFVARLAGYARGALRYWEPRRLFYNLVLAVVVVAHFVGAWPASKDRLTLDLVLGIFFLAVLSNVRYCAVYPVDLFVQFAGVRETWQKGRVALLVIGTAFAGVIAHFFASGIFGK